MARVYACREITAAQVTAAVSEAYESGRKASGGKNADYIPYLASMDSKLFALAVCLPDGTVVAQGDSQAVFGIESVAKVPTALLAMEQLGAETVAEKIGANATGMPFNSIMAILLENHSPASPLVNAGAIATCSLIEPVGDAKAKDKAIGDFMGAMAGSPLQFIDELYQSEAAANFNNRSMAWLLRNYDRIYDEPELALEVYTRQGSYGVTCEQLAIMAATIACDGYNPVTDSQVFGDSLAPKVTSLMATSGFYENSGTWIYETGLPAKSGVGGGILAVMPGLFGVAAFAPPLDSYGNSLRGQVALKAFMEALDLNIYSGTRICQLVL